MALIRDEKSLKEEIICLLLQGSFQFRESAA